jgi:hypothetical protein
LDRSWKEAVTNIQAFDDGLKQARKPAVRTASLGPGSCAGTLRWSNCCGSTLSLIVATPTALWLATTCIYSTSEILVGLRLGNACFHSFREVSPVRLSSKNVKTQVTLPEDGCLLVAPCSLVEVYSRFRGVWCLIALMDGGKHLWNVGKLPDYTAQELRRQSSSRKISPYSLQWQPEISANFTCCSFYHCGMWSAVWRKEHKLGLFKNGVPRTVFGSTRVEVTGGWKTLHNEKFSSFAFFTKCCYDNREQEDKMACSPQEVDQEF